MIDWESLLSVLIIVFVVLFLPMILKGLAGRAKKRMEPPQHYEEREEEEEEEEQFVPPLPIAIREKNKVTEGLVIGDYEFHDHLENEPKVTAIEERHIESKIHPEFKKEVVSGAFHTKAKTTLKHTHHPLFAKMEKMSPLKKMVVYSEIMTPPWE